MAAYYNEIEPYAAQWLRNLIKGGHIADGEIDTRSIIDVQPADLAGYTQCHFFAGIGGWSHALRLAGWPDDRPIWTGSAPCQPFSVAGKGAGIDDPRHLWPHFHRLISACRPPVVMGEQVAGAAGYGWLDGVRADLAREDYASRGVDIPACAVDAPHIRQRLYWVAEDLGKTNSPHGERSSLPSGIYTQDYNIDSRSTYRDMADASDQRCEGVGLLRDGRSEVPEASGSSESHMADANGGGPRAERGNDGEMRRVQEAQREPEHGTPVSGRGGSEDGDVADAASLRQQQRQHAGGVVRAARTEPKYEPFGNADSIAGGGAATSFWDDHIWLTGADGKARRSKPGLPLLAHGVPNRVGKLRAYGNAIVPPLAAEVIRAYMDNSEGESK